MFNVETTLAYQLVNYKPLSKDECLANKDKLGLKYCPHNNDHLAGAAFACGHINNLPSPDELLLLARKIYNSNNTHSIRGSRNDQLMKDLNIWINERRIFYWSNREDNNRKTGLVRMFDAIISTPYSVMRDGSAYIVESMPQPQKIDGIYSHPGKMPKQSKKRFKLSPYAMNVSNNHSNFDALVAICISNGTNSVADNILDEKNAPSLRGMSYSRFCALFCGKGAQYLKTKRQNGLSTRICVQDQPQNDEQICTERSGSYQNIRYVCECSGNSIDLD